MPFLYDGQTETVQAAALAALAAVQLSLARLLTAPGSAPLALAQDLPLLAAVAPDNQAGYAVALASLLADYVAAIVGDVLVAAPPAAPAGYEYSSRLPPLPPDPSYGLGALAAVGAVISPPSATGQIAVNWMALMQLVEGNATTALATLYAQSSFASAADADMAREQIFALITAQIAPAAGNDVLVMAWRALFTAAVTDLTTRASGLPDIAVVTSLAPLPALYLAELVYQDGSQAPVLVQRNSAPHPLFMPLAVEYLAAA